MSLSVFGAGSQPFMRTNGAFDHSVCRDHVLDYRPDPGYETRGTCPLLEVCREAPHAFTSTRLVRIQTRREVLEELPFPFRASDAHRVVALTRGHRTRRDHGQLHPHAVGDQGSGEIPDRRFPTLRRL